MLKALLIVKSIALTGCSMINRDACPTARRKRSMLLNCGVDRLTGMNWAGVCAVRVRRPARTKLVERSGSLAFARPTILDSGCYKGAKRVRREERSFREQRVARTVGSFLPRRVGVGVGCGCDCECAGVLDSVALADVSC